MSVLSDSSPIQFSTAKDAIYIDATSGRVVLTPQEARDLAAELISRAGVAERWGK